MTTFHHTWGGVFFLQEVSHPHPKRRGPVNPILLTQMLTRDVFAIANLLDISCHAADAEFFTLHALNLVYVDVTQLMHAI